MEKINFEKWLMNNHLIEENLEYYIKYLYLYIDYLPNFEDFIVWFADEENGILAILYLNKINRDDFINEFENKINKYENFEKLIYIKILLSIVEEHNNWYEKNFETKGKEEEEILEYIDEWNLWNSMNLYFDLQFKKLNKNLPSLIKDKSKNLISLDDPYPKVGWTIEKNPNYKEITQTPPPDEVEPITLPENIKTTKVNTIRLLHYTGILEFLLKKYPRMNESNLASFFELITKTPITHKNQNTHFYKNNDNSMYHKDDLVWALKLNI